MNSVDDVTSTSVSSVDSQSTGGDSSVSQQLSPTALGGTMAALPVDMMEMEKTYADVEAWLAKLYVGTPLTEAEVKSLTELARERFLSESNVHPVPTPVTIVGVIHGQWHDLMEIFRI